MTTFRFVSRGASVAGLLLAAACSDADPTGPVAPGAPAEPVTLAQVACHADVGAGTVSCDTSPRDASGARTDLVLGGQRVYVLLASSGIAVTDVPDPAQPDTFAFDVTVQNLIPQPLATTDGATLAAGGVRVFFHREPTVVEGVGTIEVANEDGQGTFTAGGQPYFEYDAVLDSADVSGARRWKLAYTPGVQRFDFVLFVSAAVQFPDGWVQIENAADTLVSGTTRTLTALVRDRVGRPIPGQTVSWQSSAPGSVSLVPGDAGSAQAQAVTVGSAVLSARTATLPARPRAVTVTHGPVAAVVNAGRTGLNVAPGQVVPDSVVVRVTDAQGNPIAGVGVSWDLPSGGSMSPASGLTRADGTVRGAWTAGTAAGAQEARARLGAYGAITPASVTVTVETQGRTRTWTGASATPSAWAEPDNWSPRGVPTALDTVLVAASATPAGRIPTLSAASVAGTLLTDGTLALGSADLTVLDSASLAGRVAGSGSLVLRGGTSLRGEVPSVVVQLQGAADTVRLQGSTRLTGSLTLSAGSLILAGQRLRVEGDLTNANGRLVSRNASDTLSVAGTATFRSSSVFSAGTAQFQGNLVIAYCTCSYTTSAGHVTVLDGSAAQSVKFDQFGSSFATAVVRNPAGVVFDGVQSTSQISGALTLDPGARVTVPLNKMLLVVGNLILEAGSGVTNFGTLDVRGSIVDRSGSPNPIGPNPAI